MDSELNSLLQTLGLTEYEAKTLTTLFKMKETEAPEISRTAQVPKTRVYDVLEKLEKKGLVIEIYGRPKKYRVVEPKHAINELLKQKKTELAELEKKAGEIHSFFSSGENEANSSGERVMKVKDKNDFLRILSQEIESAKSRVIGMSKLDENQEILKKSLQNALGRNVAVKIVSRVPKALEKDAKSLLEKGMEIRDHDHGLNAYVIDGKKVILALSDFEKEKPEYHFTIWNNNQPMANAVQRYFEQCWEEGKNI